MDGSWREVLLRDPCVYCGELATSIDHIVPVVDGGPNHWTNYAPSCHDCNAAKGRRSVFRFLAGAPRRRRGPMRKAALATWTRAGWQRWLLSEVQLWGVSPVEGNPTLLRLATRQMPAQHESCAITPNTGVISLISNRGVTSL